MQGRFFENPMISSFLRRLNEVRKGNFCLNSVRSSWLQIFTLICVQCVKALFSKRFDSPAPNPPETSTFDGSMTSMTDCRISGTPFFTFCGRNNQKWSKFVTIYFCWCKTYCARSNRLFWAKILALHLNSIELLGSFLNIRKQFYFNSVCRTKYWIDFWLTKNVSIMCSAN